MRDFLTVMPTKKYLNMTLVLGPVVYQTQGGWAGACIIAESHISVHCVGWEVHADIFSCKEFDTGVATDLAVKVLGLDKLRTQILNRSWRAIPAEVGV